MSDKKKVSICVVGLGVGMLHARAYSGMEEAQLFVCDTDPLRVQQAEKELNVAGSFTSVEEALSSPAIQAVDICLPNGLHGSTAVTAARHGKHCFVEKPLATSLSEADEMKTECAKADTLLAVAENWQFSALTLKAAQMVRSGKVGTVFLIESLHEMWPIYFGKSTWWFNAKLAGGGVLLSAGVHAIRTLRMLSPSRLTAVYAASNSKAVGIQAEDTCLVTTEFEDGSMGFIAASWATPHAPYLFAVHGTEGSILGGWKGELRLKANKPGDERETQVQVGTNDTIREECQAFVDSVIQGKVDDRISFERGRADVEVVEAAYTSAAKKQRVTLPL